MSCTTNYTCRFRGILLFAAALGGLATPLHAQDESALRNQFEGLRVIPTLDLPGTSEGVTIRPAEPVPIDRSKVWSLQKKYPTAIPAGTAAAITRIRVKKNLIEVQLDGGGFGTAGDVFAALGEGASLTAEQEVARRTAGGSRFNLRYQGKVPESALTAEGIRQALRDVLLFPGDSGYAEALASAAPNVAAPKASVLDTSPTEATDLAPARASPPARLDWQVHVGWDNQLFPSYLLATSSSTVLVQRPGSEPVLGHPNGAIAVRVVSPATASRVSAEVSIPGLLTSIPEQFDLPEAGVGYVLRPRLAWDYSALAKVEQTRPLSVIVTVKSEGFPDVTQVVSATLRPAGEVPWTVLRDDVAGVPVPEDFSWMFAAFVNETHPANDVLRREALNAGIVRQFDGYQSGDPAQVAQQVYAIWNALQRRGVKYSSITTTAGSSQKVFSQRVRFVGETMEMAQANCVDGSVLFASLLRQIGIDPVLVLIPGHMYMGFYLDPGHQQIAYLETTILGDADVRAGGDFLGLAALFGHDPSWQTFQTAWAKGASHMERDRPRIVAGEWGYRLIDVAQVRKAGILPIAVE